MKAEAVKGEREKTMEVIEKSRIESFKDLRVWQNGMKLCRDIYALSRELPKDEIYGLVSQMKRAAVSIPSNIAEGHSRNHRNEYKQFIYIAIGSLAELETQVVLIKELSLLRRDAETETIEAEIQSLRAMLITLGRKL